MGGVTLSRHPLPHPRAGRIVALVWEGAAVASAR